MLTTIRWTLTGPVLPGLRDALRVGEATKVAVHGCAGRAFERAIPPVLSGHGLAAGTPHLHAFYLPEDADLDGCIDHIIVHAAMGLTSSIVDALRDFRPRLPARCVVRDLTAGDASAIGSSLLGEARRWISLTPYMPPRHAKKDRDSRPEEQLGWECRQRRLELPNSIERLRALKIANAVLHADKFERRQAKHRPAPMMPGWFLRLTFDEAIAGPIAFGYGCHCGLGLFRPIAT